MFQNKVKILILASLWLICFCILLGLKTADHSVGVTNALSQFKEGTAEFSGSSLKLKEALSLLRVRDIASLNRAKQALSHSRLSYKKIEFFLNYFFESSAMIYNRPAKAEVDEPYMEYQEPSGFQLIEAMLFDADPLLHKEELLQQADLLCSSAPDLNSLLYGFKGTDQEILESTRLELVRVITLSITGYDAPELKTGIPEAYQSLAAVQKALSPYLAQANTEGKSPDAGQSLSLQLDQTLAYLQDHPDFDSFNRMEFLTVYALPLQELLGDFITKQQLVVNYKSSLNYKAKNIFSSNAFDEAFFNGDSIPNPNKNRQRDLGKKLFAEQSLSGNLKRSCQSCHRPEQYFTDGLKTSVAFDEHSFVQRNAPTLLYAGFQFAQFWDGRVKTLPEQIKNVIANPIEMNGDHKVVIANLKNRSGYVEAFKQAFPSTTNPITIDNLAQAIAAYVMALKPMNSDFDRYLAGDKKAMSTEQLKGFNLFMGKGQCGSCHFAPLFNGLIPPFYKLTEYEVLGTPANDDFKRLQQDQDRGRYGFFPISYYTAAFKTPTVRNAAKTAPYMHNGAFKDLEKVVEFYNQGGGAGLGLPAGQQTLSQKPLQLTPQEVQEIVSFMQSLTDKLD
jgi:cytochrome c peroxidase